MLVKLDVPKRPGEPIRSRDEFEGGGAVVPMTTLTRTLTST